jgi:hypothetical protein
MTAGPPPPKHIESEALFLSAIAILDVQDVETERR